MESDDILEGSLGGWIVDEKDTLGPSQVSEEISVNGEQTRSYPLLPITIPENLTRPLNDIQDKYTIIWQSHGFLAGTWGCPSRSRSRMFLKWHARRSGIGRLEGVTSSMYEETTPRTPASETGWLMKSLLDKRLTRRLTYRTDNQERIAKGDITM